MFHLIHWVLTAQEHLLSGSQIAIRRNGEWFSCRKNLKSLNVAGTNLAWSVFINAVQKKSLHISCLDISSHILYDRVFCVLNPFIAGGHINRLAMGDMKGDPIMVEGVCGSLLLNTNLKETSLVLDDMEMDCMDDTALISSSFPRTTHFSHRSVEFVAGTLDSKL